MNEGDPPSLLFSPMTLWSKRSETEEKWSADIQQIIFELRQVANGRALKEDGTKLLYHCRHFILCRNLFEEKLE